MGNFFKKYWSHILNIVYIVFVDAFMGFCIFAMNNEEQMEGVPLAIIPIMILIELVLTFLVLGEMIYAIVVAAKDNELKNKALHIVGAYFFNVFYIPCFFLSFVHKDKNALIKNIIYVIVEVSLWVVLTVLISMLTVSSI